MSTLGETDAEIRDRGAIDGGLEVLVGGVMVICFVLLIVEATAFWHSRNIMDAAAAEAARVAAAFDGSCNQATSAGRALVTRRAGGWAETVEVACARDGDLVTVRITGHSPGILFGRLGFEVAVAESAPVER